MVFQLVGESTPSKCFVDTRRLETSQVVVEVRAALEGSQDPDPWLRKSSILPPSVHCSGCSEKWGIWILDIKNARHQADVSCRGVLLRAAVEWVPEGTRLTWEKHAPANVSKDAPAALFIALFIALRFFSGPGCPEVSGFLVRT